MNRRRERERREISEYCTAHLLLSPPLFSLQHSYLLLLLSTLSPHTSAGVGTSSCALSSASCCARSAASSCCSDSCAALVRTSCVCIVCLLHCSDVQCLSTESNQTIHISGV